MQKQPTYEMWSNFIAFLEQLSKTPLEPEVMSIFRKVFKDENSESGANIPDTQPIETIFKLDELVSIEEQLKPIKEKIAEYGQNLQSLDLLWCLNYIFNIDSEETSQKFYGIINSHKLKYQNLQKKLGKQMLELKIKSMDILKKCMN